MIKVMLVDDEEMTRSGLREFISWEQLGLEVAGEAEDGEEALERFMLLRPEIVLCDVRMPRMDGITLAGKLKELAPDCKIIFLSGYSDVAYLKSAIKLQAVDYIEKPVQIHELEALLGRTAEEISKSREENSKLLQIRKALDENLAELTGKALKELFQLSSPADPGTERILEELFALHGGFPREGKYICCVFTAREAAEWDLWEGQAIAEGKAQELMLLAAVMDGMGVVCFSIRSDSELERISLWLNRMLRKEDNQQAYSAGVGSICHHPAALGRSYREALKALQHRFYRGWNTSIWHSKLPQEGQLKQLLFDKQNYIRFEELLKQRDIDAAIDLLDQCVNDLVLFPSPDIDAVRTKLFRWYVAMTKLYPETMWEFENDELWSSVFVAGELYTIRNFMIRRLGIIKENMEIIGQPAEKSVIREVVKYIQANYDGDVSIASIAGHVYLTPTYLCILFKKEKGISINDYITQFRIEKAKQLLKDRKLKLYEIAGKVGYQDANYFAKVFRKLTGMNPSEFREKTEEGFL